MSKILSGFEKVQITKHGTGFDAPDATIEEQGIVTDGSQLEVEENEDQTDPNGESPHTGQFGVLSIESTDFAVRSTLTGYRTADPEQLVDVRVHTAGGQTITSEGVRAKTSLGTLASEKGQANTWDLATRTWVPGHIDFD